MCVARPNTDVSIDCQFFSNPSGSLEAITYPNILEDNIRTEGSTIVLTNVLPMNQGNYECVISNVVLTGIVIQSLRVTLRVLGKPFFVSNLTLRRLIFLQKIKISNPVYPPLHQ